MVSVRSLLAMSVVVGMTVGTWGCSKTEDSSTNAASGQATQQAVTMTGAGATFPAPIYTKWAEAYQQKTGNMVNYQGIGSSGGVKQIKANTVDFGGTDAPISDADLAEHNLFQFPTVIGGVVLVVNVPGIKSGELVLDGKTLGDIYLGRIKNWNDAAIKKLNPTLSLPNQEIAVVRRADGSGTSFVFTNYLNKVNQDWSKDIGAGSTVNWPVGVGGKGNDGVAAFVQRLPGSIGYVEYAYAKQNSLTYTSLISADGETLQPSRDSFSAAAKEVDWNQSFAQDLTNRAGANAWPIASTTFIVVPTKVQAKDQRAEVIKFFDWAFKEGAAMAQDLDYAVLPDTVVEQIRSAWKAKLVDAKGVSLYQ